MPIVQRLSAIPEVRLQATTGAAELGSITGAGHVALAIWTELWTCGPNVAVVTTVALFAIFNASSWVAELLALVDAVLDGVVGTCVFVWQGTSGSDRIEDAPHIRPVLRDVVLRDCWHGKNSQVAFGPDCQTIASATHGSVVTRASHVAIRVGSLRSAIAKEIVAEALDTVLHTSDAVTHVVTCGNARGLRQGVVIRLLILHDTAIASIVIVVTASVGPIGWDCGLGQSRDGD